MLGETLISIALVIAVLWLYFIPTFVARKKKHHNQHAIFLVNLLLGWTFLGWVGALVWASLNPPPSRAGHDRASDWFDDGEHEDNHGKEWDGRAARTRHPRREDYAFDEDAPSVRSLPPYLLKEKKK